MHYDFIEIGTSDFDTFVDGHLEYGKPGCPDHFVGLCIDPIYEYVILGLSNKPRVTKVVAAVSDCDGTAEIHYIPEDTIKKYDFLPWTRGCNRINDYHPFTELEPNRVGLDVKPENIAVKRTVPKISVNTLIQTYLIESCDYLRIDTEGHDSTIIKAFVKAWKQNLMEKPKKIEFECHPLVVDHRIVDMTIELLEENDFKLYHRDFCNVIMLRHDQWPYLTVYDS